MEDDFIKKMETHHERWHGEQWEPQKTLETFPLYGRAKRIEALQQLDSEIKETPATEGALRTYTRLTSLQRNLERIHQAQIKVGR
jgi:hypothetical protein